MDRFRVEIEATEGGMKKVRLTHPGGREVVIKILQAILPVVGRLDRTLRQPDRKEEE